MTPFPTPNLAGAVERLPMPLSNVARVAKRVADSLSEGRSPAVTGEINCEAGELEVADEKEFSQSLAPLTHSGGETKKLGR